MIKNLLGRRYSFSPIQYCVVTASDIEISSLLNRNPLKHSKKDFLCNRLEFINLLWSLIFIKSNRCVSDSFFISIELVTKRNSYICVTICLMFQMIDIGSLLRMLCQAWSISRLTAVIHQFSSTD